MILSSVSLGARVGVASRQMNHDARVGAHPSDFCSGKSHQNHSLRDTTLRVPCIPRQSWRKKNSQLRRSNTFLLSPPLPAVLGGVQSQLVAFSNFYHHFSESWNSGKGVSESMLLPSRALRSQARRSRVIKLSRLLHFVAIITVGSSGIHEKPTKVSRLARRASQSLTGVKRGVSERSELASACQGQDAQSSRQAALAGCLFLCLLSFGQAKERRVPRRTRRIQNNICRETTLLKI
ncbi:MAG: hypothetical protein P8Z33_15110 [Gammaproteobacteria bacterium]